MQRYVPTFPDKGAPITPRLVGGHLAGIRHYQGNEFLLNRRFATVTEGLAIFENDSLLFPPGTRFSYSTYGFNLLRRGPDSLRAALLSPAFLKAETLELLFTVQHTTAVEATPYGIGWCVARDSLRIGEVVSAPGDSPSCAR